MHSSGTLQEPKHPKECESHTDHKQRDLSLGYVMRAVKSGHRDMVQAADRRDFREKARTQPVVRPKATVIAQSESRQLTRAHPA